MKPMGWVMMAAGLVGIGISTFTEGTVSNAAFIIGIALELIGGYYVFDRKNNN